tara:strand:- start:14132 stop:14494 length:363 start_codon:yes stop_codon:yes gene_type:complete
MGRYYYGDIEGKFMFAVQPSNAAERFGADEFEASIDYTISRSKYEMVCAELLSIEKTGAPKRVKEMFKATDDRWSDDILDEHGVTQDDMREYADWVLGTKLKDYFDDHPNEDVINFQAER